MHEANITLKLHLQPILLENLRCFWFYRHLESAGVCEDGRQDVSGTGVWGPGCIIDEVGLVGVWHPRTPAGGSADPKKAGWCDGLKETIGSIFFIGSPNLA